MKRFISKFMLIGIILIFLFKTNIIAENKFEDGQVLKGILEDIGGEQIEEDISFNGVISDKFLYKDEMNNLGSMIKEKIGITGVEVDPFKENDILPESFYSKSVIFEEDFSQISYSGFDKDKNKLQIFLSSYLDKEMDFEETYLYINFIKSEQFSKESAIINDIRELYDEFDRNVEITTCIVGDFSGELGYNNIEEKINYISEEHKIETLDCFLDDNLYSYSMYTPLIKDFLLIDKKQINLNLAIRYNVYEDKTYIMIGTPIIANGY